MARTLWPLADVPRLNADNQLTEASEENAVHHDMTWRAAFF